ncbi:MAG: ATP-binding protein [Thermodesulfobacteriota bacterium]|nr:ATP-binding protein [Thermodesulfobacteriota bacterium]
MIRLIEALDFRCLRYINQSLDRFLVLVGPNASGKSTFLDVVALMGQIVSDGLELAVHKRTKNFQDLVWQRSGDSFELAVELDIPGERRTFLKKSSYDTVRYEVRIGVDQETGKVSILSEKVLLKKSLDHDNDPIQSSLFHSELEAPQTLITPKAKRNTKTVVNKVMGGNDNFYDETGKGWDHSFKLGPCKSALGNLPDDESKFPVATWLKALFVDGVQRLVLNNALMRRPSPPGQPKRLRQDGSNLPWVIHSLKANAPERFQDWLGHLKTALPDLRDIHTVVRPEDRHCYLQIEYGNNLEVPSWMVSDGTLRLLALTIPAYLPELKGIYIIEEPENGVHPRAVETIFQSLSSVYDAQILLSTYSQVILSIARASKALCFSKTENGATNIVIGSEHPALLDWKGETNLGMLIAGGIMG